MAWIGHSVQAVLRLAAVVVLLLGLLALILTQTDWGRERVILEVLARVEGSIRGELHIRSVSSSGLHRGFTFHEVRISGEDGRTFLEADSVRGTVVLSSLVRGDLVFSRVTAWRPHVILERLPGQDRMNVVTLFGGGPPPDADHGMSVGAGAPEAAPPASEGRGASPGEPMPAGEAERPGGDPSSGTPQVSHEGEGPGGEALGPDPGGRSVVLRGVRLVDGTLDIFTPLEEEQRASPFVLVAHDPDGLPSLRRMTFREIDLHMGEVVLAAPNQSGERYELRGLSFRGWIGPEPFRVSGAAGQLRREEDHFQASFSVVELPGSRAHGTLEVDWSRPGDVVVEVEGEADPLALSDIRFLEERLPVGDARGAFAFVLDRRGLFLDLRDTELRSPLGRLRGTGGVLLGPEIVLRDLALQMADADLAITDPWVPRPLPLRGFLSGSLALDGDLDSLAVDAQVSFVDPDSTGVTEATVSGAFHLRDGFGVTAFSATLAPMEWGTLAGLSPFLTLRGPGSIRLEARGSLAGGMGVTADATHFPDPLSPSRLTLEGTLIQGPTGLVLNLLSELRPLSSRTLREGFPGFLLAGEYSGTVTARGPLRDLELSSQLVTPGGPLELKGRLDVAEPEDGYSLEVTGTDLLLSRLLPGLPEPTRLSGRLAASGIGLNPESAVGEATLQLGRGEVGFLDVDTAALVARVGDGLLHLDVLWVETEVGMVEAGGSFAVADGGEGGELTVLVKSESLAPLRPLVMGERTVVLDELTPFERDLLAMEGVNLDTLPTSAQVAVGGRVEGGFVLRGGFYGFAGEGSLSFQEIRFRSDYVKSGSAALQGEGFPGAGSRVRAQVRTDSLNIRSLGFRGGQAEVDLGRWSGHVALSATRGRADQYQARGDYRLNQEGGGTLELEDLSFAFASEGWALQSPATLTWSPRGFHVGDFRLSGLDDSPLRVRVDGFLPREGEGDFGVEVRQLDLARVARLAQMETPLEGVVDAAGRYTGPAREPMVVSSFTGRALRYDVFSLDGAEVDVRWLGGVATLDLTADDRGGRVLLAGGVFPADLRVDSRGPRIPEGPVDIAITADAFPAAIALAFLEDLQEVEGALTGEIHLGGTSRDLVPTGALSLADGAVTLPALGVRMESVEGSTRLLPGGLVEVDGSARSGGRARVTGTVKLQPASDPELALDVEARDFLAVNRRDMQARVSGNVRLEQRYRTPRVRGGLTVEQGVLVVEELARSAEVVDLSDPSFFDVVDTTFVTLRPILEASQNPFLQNLLLEVDVSMGRDTWLRGRDLNVEMTGDLQLSWDLTERDMVLVGDLYAVRGVYGVLGRQFQVQEGTVRFQGIPGINPELDITALNSLRTYDGDRFDVIATVQGTLLSPRVSLSSNAPFPIGESDLVSYLIFGRPTYALASGQSAAAQGAAGALLGAATGATANLALGTLSAELGSVFARNVGLDYLAISQDRDAAYLGTLDLAGTVATTQVEIGQYLADGVFAALLWRPLTGLGGTSLTPFAGLRLEWRMTDAWTLEGFVEDLFSRRSLFRGVEPGIQTRLVPGFFLYREWGY
jgi:translocation and assembly module TamB